MGQTEIEMRDRVRWTQLWTSKLFPILLIHVYNGLVHTNLHVALQLDSGRSEKRRSGIRLPQYERLFTDMPFLYVGKPRQKEITPRDAQNYCFRGWPKD